MGEEKPDEELMGKRKSSPRLSTTFGDVDSSSFVLHSQLYTFVEKKLVRNPFFNHYLIVVR
ncbi:hypothetical protein D3C80_1757540 [compost metagenome]